MALYEIIGYSQHSREHTIKGEDGLTYQVDLFVDASFEKDPLESAVTAEDIYKVERELVGQMISVEELQPIAFYAKGVKLIEPSTITE